MNRSVRTSALALCAGLILSVLGQEAHGQTIAWTSDYTAAMQQAKSTGKLLLVNIHATWCVPCKKLQATTLSDPSLGAEIMQNCIPLSLDADQDRNVIRQWPVNAFPTQLFIAPDGRIVNTIIGNVSVNTYRAALYKAVQATGGQAMAAAPTTKQPTAPSGPPEVVTRPTSPPPTTQPAPAMPPTPPNAVLASSDPSAGFPPPPSVATNDPVFGQPSPPQPSRNNPVDTPPAFPESFTPPEPPMMTASQTTPVQEPSGTGEPAMDKDIRPCDMSVPLGLRGYCPVSMIERAELIEGLKDYCCVYKTKRYQFNSEQDMSMFLEEPRKYLPSEEGYCVVSWAVSHTRQPGSIDYPALFGDHLFLFANDDARQRFLRDPEQFVDANGRAHRIPLQTFRGERETVR